MLTHILNVFYLEYERSIYTLINQPYGKYLSLCVHTHILDKYLSRIRELVRGSRRGGGCEAVGQMASS